MFINTVLGWMLQDRPFESVRDKDGKIRQLGQRDLLDMLEGTRSTNGLSDELIAESYRTDGDPLTGKPMHPLRIKMLQELRHAKDPRAKMEIKARYANHFAVLAEQAETEGDG